MGLDSSKCTRFCARFFKRMANWREKCCVFGKTVLKLNKQVYEKLHSVMSGQKKISTFFQPLTQKTNDPIQESERPAKKLKTAQTPKKIPQNEENEPKADLLTPERKGKSPEASSPPISPEQKERMEQNKLSAEMKVTATKTKGLVVNMGQTWFKALNNEFNKPYFEKLCTFVSQERAKHTVYPPADQVFMWTNTCKIQQVKVVILGQDPYHGPNQAHGLCFSVRQGVNPPPSLENMYKELLTDIEGFKHPGHGELTGWATQGVLLLNACLTVRAANANSHKDQGWEKFTDAVVSWINNNLSGVVFLLWGSYAQKKGACINTKKHHILKTVHPSPLSAHRGFFGCKHFSQCNKLLKGQGDKPIDWTHLPRSK